jgi:hypothetical protein
VHYAPVTWWKPWTWFRVDGVEVVREREFSAIDKALLLAQKRNAAEMGPHGVPMSEAVDPKNQFGVFEAPAAPTTDWAAKALGDAQDAYYKKYPDTSRHGHIWRLKNR